jgi:hypothetical protein
MQQREFYDGSMISAQWCFFRALLPFLFFFFSFPFFLPFCGAGAGGGVCFHAGWDGKWHDNKGMTYMMQLKEHGTNSSIQREKMNNETPTVSSLHSPMFRR